MLLRQLEESGQNNDLDQNIPWFTDPSQGETHHCNEATAVSVAKRPIKIASTSLEGQLERSQDHTLALQSEAESLREQQRDLIAAAKARLKASTAKDGIFEHLGRLTTQAAPETAHLLTPDEKRSPRHPPPSAPRHHRQDHPLSNAHLPPPTSIPSVPSTTASSPPAPPSPSRTPSSQSNGSSCRRTAPPKPPQPSAGVSTAPP